jgi:beta-barrel assembly-enhancing protease
MKKNRHNTNGLILFIVSSIAFILISGAPDISAMSIDEETKLGNEFLASVKKEVPLMDDGFVDEYLTNLGNYLGQYQGAKPFSMDFHVIKDSQLNAFAGPAGHIFVYSGLINAMDQVDELASVISHEEGHVEARHLSNQADKSKLVGLGTLAGVLAGALIGGQAADALIVGSMAAGIQKQLSYSRDDERQADQMGFKKAYEAGFTPEAFISALEELQRGDYSSVQTPAYLLTHPVDSERMSNLEAMSHEYTGSVATEEVKHFRNTYPLFRTIIKAQTSDPKDAEKYFKSELEKTPESSLAHLGLGIAMERNGQYSGAIEHYNKALEGQSEKAPILRYLGETYQMNGQAHEAINALEKALAINNKDKATLYMLAMSYQETEEYPKAVEIFEKLTFLDPVRDDVFYNLGMSLGREGNLGPAHYNFGLYYKKLGEAETAQFHFKKASELAGNDQILQDKIKKEMEAMKKEKPAKPPAS